MDMAINQQAKPVRERCVQADLSTARRIAPGTSAIFSFPITSTAPALCIAYS
jgi:hypothetical protein